MAILQGLGAGSRATALPSVLRQSQSAPPTRALSALLTLLAGRGLLHVRQPLAAGFPEFD